MQTHPAAQAATRPGALRRAIGPLWRELRLAYLHWARREIHPLHADLPGIILSIRQLQDQRQGGAA